MDVMRGAFDAHGHDVVFEVSGVLRQVQLKAMVAGGKRRDVSVNMRLRSEDADVLHLSLLLNLSNPLVMSQTPCRPT